VLLIFLCAIEIFVVVFLFLPESITLGFSKTDCVHREGDSSTEVVGSSYKETKITVRMIVRWVALILNTMAIAYVAWTTLD